MSKKINRIMFAAPRSGSGKTMITCGFLNLLKKRKLDVTSYKCGPDYIDVSQDCAGNIRRKP